MTSFNVVFKVLERAIGQRGRDREREEERGGGGGTQRGGGKERKEK